MSHDLQLDEALELMAGIRRHARQRGIGVTACIVDGGGNMMTFARMDGVILAANRFAEAKAYTAAAWEQPSGMLSAGIQPGQGGFGMNTIDSRFIFCGGGTPIFRDGRIVGGVGVSGADPAEEVDCALVALAASPTLSATRQG
jgi:uncharacterized protein GlcG (DUF336 family)